MQSPPVLKRCFTWGNPKTALFATRTNMRLAIILTEPYFLTSLSLYLLVRQGGFIHQKKNRSVHFSGLLPLARTLVAGG
jgi:hypothetical protein